MKNFILKGFTMRHLTLLAFVVFSFMALAEQSPKLEDLEALPEVPEPPLPIQNGENMEPDITITRKGDKNIQEFRRGGRLYMIKVVPDIGPPYYFLDVNGDGKLDVRSSDLDQASRFNMWKLLEW